MRRSLQAVLGVGLALGGALAAQAQEQRAALEGVVRDSQGEAMPGVAVAARNADGLAVKGVTDRSGLSLRFAAPRPERPESGSVCQVP